MAFKLGNRVHETSTTTGTGTLTLAGAITGALAFSSQLSSGDTTYYAIWDDNDIEVGLGTYTNTSGQQLSRDAVYYSTNGNAKVNWASGTRNVAICLPAEVAEDVFTQFATGTQTFTSVAAAATATPVNVAHGLGSDDIDFGCSVFGSLSWGSGGENVAAKLVGTDKRFIHAGIGGTNNPSVVSLPSTGELRIGAYNGASNTQNITVKWWARRRA